MRETRIEGRKKYFLKKLQLDISLNVIERVPSLRVWNGCTEVGQMDDVTG